MSPSWPAFGVGLLLGLLVAGGLLFGTALLFRAVKMKRNRIWAYLGGSFILGAQFLIATFIIFKSTLVRESMISSAIGLLLAIVCTIASYSFLTQSKK